MKKFSYLLLVALITIVILLGFSWNLIPATEAALQEKAVLLYDAQPKTYNHTVQEPYYSCPQCTGNGYIREEDKGKTFTDNIHHWGWEIYRCDSKGGTVTTYNTLEKRTMPVDQYSKRSQDICIPRATAAEGSKHWPEGIAPNFANLECNEVQHLLDGPNQTEDNRTLNGTGQPNSQIRVCSERSAADRGPNPYLDITTPFVYKPFMCQSGNEVVLAARQDPYADECIEVNNNSSLKNAIMAEPWKEEYKPYLSCFLYFDDEAEVTVCKDSDQNGECNTEPRSMTLSNTVNGVHPAPQPSEDLCDLFEHGQGNYNVRVQVYDVGTQVYGTSDLWLTWRDNACTVTPAINLRVPHLYSTSATLVWDSGTGGDKQWVMLDEDRSKVENDCADGCRVDKRDLWDDQTVYPLYPSLSPDTTYYWKVFEVDTTVPNCRIASEIASFTTPKDCNSPISKLYVKGPGDPAAIERPNGTSATFVGNELLYYVQTKGPGTVEFFRDFGHKRLTQVNQWQKLEFETTIPSNFEHYGGIFYAIAGTKKRNSVVYYDNVKVEVWDSTTGTWNEITTNYNFERGVNGSVPEDWQNNSYLADHDNYKTGPMDGISPPDGSSSMVHIGLGDEFGHHGSQITQIFDEDLRGERVRMSGWAYSKYSFSEPWVAEIVLGYWNIEGGDIKKINYGIDGNMQVYNVPGSAPRHSAETDHQTYAGTGTHTISYYAEDSCSAVEDPPKTFEFTLGFAPTPTSPPTPTPIIVPPSPSKEILDENKDPATEFESGDVGYIKLILPTHQGFNFSDDPDWLVESVTINDLKEIINDSPLIEVEDLDVGESFTATSSAGRNLKDFFELEGKTLSLKPATVIPLVDIDEKIYIEIKVTFNNPSLDAVATTVDKEGTSYIMYTVSTQEGSTLQENPFFMLIAKLKNLLRKAYAMADFNFVRGFPNPEITIPPAGCICNVCEDEDCVLKGYPEEECPCTNECEVPLDCPVGITPTPTPTNTPTPTPTNTPTPTITPTATPAEPWHPYCQEGY